MKHAAMLVAALSVIPFGAQAASSSITPQGKAFLTYTVQDSIGEIGECKMAQAKSSSGAIKSFCDRMVADHTKMAAQATQLGKTLGVTIEQKPSDQSVAEKAELQKKSASDFDEDFMRAQIQDHRNDISAARAAKDSADNAQVKALTQQALSMLETHAALANATMDKLH